MSGLGEIGSVGCGGHALVAELPEPAIGAITDDQLRSTLQEVMGDRSAHLTETNKAKSHRILLTHVQNSSVPSE